MSLNQELHEIDSLLAAFKAKREIVLKELEESEPEAKQMCLEGTQENVVDSALHGVLKKALFRFGDIDDICRSSKAFGMQKKFMKAIEYEGGEVNEFIQRLVVVGYEILIDNFRTGYHYSDTHVVTFGFKEGDKAQGATFSMGFEYDFRRNCDIEEFYGGYFIPAGAVEGLKEDLKQPLTEDSKFFEDKTVARAFGFAGVSEFCLNLKKLCCVLKHIPGFTDADGKYFD
eukprot:TRINITY_DN150_c0_g1_i1.p1 TRINITY_DN150_c0_g1~~TRINITY_DN150_c0_g1_i1.p1  ORF type:complete len:250 (-),score=65.32 TRINITY_DN150_c0_g1_i1:133-819(-)